MLLLRNIHTLARGVTSVHKFQKIKHACFNCNNLTIRNYSIIRVRPFNEAYYMKKDKIPQGYQIIYKAPMGAYFSVSKNLTTATVFVIGLAALSEFGNLSNFVSVPMPLDIGGLVSDSTDLLYFLGGFLTITIALRVMINRYPLRIYRKESKYTAIFEGQLPFTYGRLHFTKGDAVEMPAKGIFPWRDSMYKVKNRKLFLLVDYFKTPSELNEMIKAVS